MKMENCEACVGFDPCKLPLSSVAQRIMSALHSGDLVEPKNWKESEKTAQLENQSSVQWSVLPGDETNQALGEKALNSFTSQTSRAPIKLSPRSSGIRLTDQLSTDRKQNISPLAPSGCLIPQHGQGAAVLQKEHERDFLKRYVNNENNECTGLKRKRGTCDPSPEETTTHAALGGEADEAAAPLNAGDSGVLGSRFCDTRCLDDLQRSQLMETLKQAGTLVVTLLYKDGSTQLSAEQAPAAPVTGVVTLLQSHPGGRAPERGRTPSARCVYIQAERPSARGQEQDAHRQFARKMLFQILTCNRPVVCFNAKDFLRTVLQFFGDDSSWKLAAGFVGLDASVAAWLLDPGSAAPAFQDLVAKHPAGSGAGPVGSTCRSSSRSVVNQNVYVDLKLLYRLTMDLCSRLKARGLWPLFCTLEIPLIPVLAVMESHSIQVNKEALKRTSALLGSRLKELEQKAHFVAGEQFLLTSNHQLREVLFGKLRLHLRGPAEPLPRTGLQGHPSTSEAVLKALQDLHPLPKIILEYRQVHKIKSAFVDGLLACMRKNIQGISKHPIRVTTPQNYEGQKEEVLSIAPRAMFVSAEGRTFLAADFSQIELRILAHLSGDPELLKLFQESGRDDVFSTLTAQWKDVPPERVTHTDRELTKKAVYSAVYGAGKERLAACLGVTVQEASRFLESFQQKFRKIKDFTQATIAQCHQTGYVVSIMGRRRPLPRIRAQDQRLRAQAERQAVNFVVQGSAADLCKMAMIRVFAAVAASSTLTARLVAQIHDELLFEVEDAQAPEFAALVRGIMESLQHVRAPELQLRVPLKVSLSAGRSWGRLEPLREAPDPGPRPRAASPSNHQAPAGPAAGTHPPRLHASPSLCP